MGFCNNRPAVFCILSCCCFSLLSLAGRTGRHEQARMGSVDERKAAGVPEDRGFILDRTHDHITPPRGAYMSVLTHAKQ